jgi:hypothetical protein
LRLVENESRVAKDISDGKSNIDSHNSFVAGNNFGDIIKVYAFGAS